MKFGAASTLLPDMCAFGKADKALAADKQAAMRRTDSAKRRRVYRSRGAHRRRDKPGMRPVAIP